MTPPFRWLIPASFSSLPPLLLSGLFCWAGICRPCLKPPSPPPVNPTGVQYDNRRRIADHPGPNFIESSPPLGPAGEMDASLCLLVSLWLLFPKPITGLFSWETRRIRLWFASPCARSPTPGYAASGFPGVSAPYVRDPKGESRAFRPHPYKLLSQVPGYEGSDFFAAKPNRLLLLLCDPRSGNFSSPPIAKAFDRRLPGNLPSFLSLFKRAYLARAGGRYGGGGGGKLLVAEFRAKGALGTRPREARAESIS